MPDRRRSTRTAIGSVHIEQDVTIDAPPWRVFDALTKDVAAWWGTPYLTAEAPKRLVLEAELGGRFYQEWPDGGGTLLARVTSLKRADHLELTGPIGRGGTVHGRTRFELKPAETGAGTVVSLSARVIGEAMDEATYAEGWNELLAVRLKGFVETGRRYGPAEAPAPRAAAPATPVEPAPKPRKPRTRVAGPRSRRKAASTDAASAAFPTEPPAGAAAAGTNPAAPPPEAGDAKTDAPVAAPGSRGRPEGPENQNR